MAFVFMAVLLIDGDECRKHVNSVGTAQALAKKALFGTLVTFWCKLSNMKDKNISPPTKSAYRQLEDVVGCKWSVSVLEAIAQGISRPGALERHIQGISTKVLSERLRKLTSFGLLVKHVYAEMPPRTEYALSPNGHKLVNIIGQLRQLNEEINDAEPFAQTGAGIGVPEGKR